MNPPDCPHIWVWIAELMLLYANWIFWFSFMLLLVYACGFNYPNYWVGHATVKSPSNGGWHMGAPIDRMESKHDKLLWHWSASHAVWSQTGIRTSDIVKIHAEICYSTVPQSTWHFPWYPCLSLWYFMLLWLFFLLSLFCDCFSIQCWSGLFGFLGVPVWWHLRLQGNTNFQSVMRELKSLVAGYPSSSRGWLCASVVADYQKTSNWGMCTVKKVEEVILKTRATTRFWGVIACVLTTIVLKRSLCKCTASCALSSWDSTQVNVLLSYTCC